MNPARVWTIAEMQARDLSRRRLAMGILAALPLAFYLSAAGEEDFGLIAGGIGMGWAVAAAGLFLSLAARRTDVRLVLSGYGPSEILAGRLLFLMGLALVLVAVFGAVMIALSDPPNPGALVAGVALTAAISVPLGLAVAALVPRELEGALTLIGVVGIEMSLPTDVALAPALPFFGPLKLMGVAAGFEPWTTAPVLHSLAAAGILLVLASVLFAKRTRVRRSALPARHGGES